MVSTSSMTELPCSATGAMMKRMMEYEVTNELRKYSINIDVFGDSFFSHSTYISTESKQVNQSDVKPTLGGAEQWNQSKEQ